MQATIHDKDGEVGQQASSSAEDGPESVGGGDEAMRVSGLVPALVEVGAVGFEDDFTVYQPPEQRVGSVEEEGEEGEGSVVDVDPEVLQAVARDDQGKGAK